MRQEAQPLYPRASTRERWKPAVHKFNSRVKGSPEGKHKRLGAADRTPPGTATPRRTRDDADGTSHGPAGLPGKQRSGRSFRGTQRRERGRTTHRGRSFRRARNATKEGTDHYAAERTIVRTPENGHDLHIKGLRERTARDTDAPNRAPGEEGRGRPREHTQTDQPGARTSNPPSRDPTQAARTGNPSATPTPSCQHTERGDRRRTRTTSSTNSTPLESSGVGPTTNRPRPDNHKAATYTTTAPTAPRAEP